MFRNKFSAQPSHLWDPFPDPFPFYLPGMIRQPMPSGEVQRNSHRLGESHSFTLPHLRGTVCHGQFSATCWAPDTVTETSPLPQGLFFFFYCASSKHLMFSQKTSARDMMHEQAHCCHEAANHQLPIAVAAFVILHFSTFKEH